MSKGLTDRQKEILDFISEFIEFNNFPPTLREIGSHFGIASTFGVKRHIDALVKKGYLKVEGNASRTITVVNRDYSLQRNDDLIEIPLVGRVAAGYPVLAEENIEGSIKVDKQFVGLSSSVFALKVRGDSMIEAGILDGDVVLVAQNKNVSNGDIVVALLSGESTLKRFEKRGNEILLIPENKNYEPIRVNKNEEFTIIGKIIGLMRNYN
jgi:repressor LexA